MIRKTFSVGGIACTGCATDIETVLRNEDGVVHASIDYSRSELVVEYDHNEISELQIVLVLKKIGLRAHVVD